MDTVNFKICKHPTHYSDRSKSYDFLGLRRVKGFGHTEYTAIDSGVIFDGLAWEAVYINKKSTRVHREIWSNEGKFIYCDSWRIAGDFLEWYKNYFYNPEDKNKNENMDRIK